MALKVGEFMLSAGTFQARMILPKSGTHAENLTCRFRVQSDVSNLSGLTEVRDKVGAGHIWTGPNGNCGWSVEAIPEMTRLAITLVNGARASQHPRLEVVEAWAHCISLLPSSLRPKLAAKGKKYKTADWQEQRRQAIQDLNRYNAQHPPAYKRLPPSYFELWT